MDAPAETRRVAVSDVTDSFDVQSRASLNTGAIEDYAEQLRDDPDFDFDPVTVFCDGEKHWLAHGFHRFRAYQNAERAEIPAEVHPGTKRDAILYSVGANAKNGLRRTSADKDRAVDLVLRDDEWRTRKSNRDIATLCHVSEFLVRTRRAICEKNADSPSSRERDVKRGDSNYTMRLPQANRKPQAAPTPELPDAEDDEPNPAPAPTMTPEDIQKRRTLTVLRECAALLPDLRMCPELYPITQAIEAMVVRFNQAAA